MSLNKRKSPKEWSWFPLKCKDALEYINNQWYLFFKFWPAGKLMHFLLIFN